jgi:hypothetical protein
MGGVLGPEGSPALYPPMLCPCGPPPTSLSAAVAAAAAAAAAAASTVSSPSLVDPIPSPSSQFASLLDKLHQQQQLQHQHQQQQATVPSKAEPMPLFPPRWPELPGKKVEVATTVPSAD